MKFKKAQIVMKNNQFAKKIKMKVKKAQIVMKNNEFTK